MAVYFITGTLGAGKSLVAVQKMREYLFDGRPVATNIDLRLHWLVGESARKLTAYRIPDHPTADDLYAIGYGNRTADEARNGALVLDECGVWFNTRNWNSKGRQKIINFLLMARKMGWDIFIIVQNINMVDVQARYIAQYVVRCMRMDRVRIPILSPIWKLITGSPIPLPTVHYAVVRLGTSNTGIMSDTWTYRGRDLYAAYNTRQVFHTEDDSQAVFSYLPPIYYRREPMIEYTPRNIMRLTRIVMRKYSRLLVGFVSALVGAASMYAAKPFIDSVDPSLIGASAVDQYADIRIVGYKALPGERETYTFEADGKRLSSAQLIQSGIRVYSNGRCKAQLEDRVTRDRREVRCG